MCHLFCFVLSYCRVTCKQFLTPLPSQQMILTSWKNPSSMSMSGLCSSGLLWLLFIGTDNDQFWSIGRDTPITPISSKLQRMSPLLFSNLTHLRTENWSAGKLMRDRSRKMFTLSPESWPEVYIVFFFFYIVLISMKYVPIVILFKGKGIFHL